MNSGAIDKVQLFALQIYSKKIKYRKNLNAKI